MERLEFIEKVFTLFRVNPENNRDLILIYDDAFSTRKPVDWEKLYKMVISQAEGSLPKPQWFISKFDSCLKPTEYTVADGLKIRVRLNNGRFYDYETYQCSMNFEQIKRGMKRRFEKQFANMQLFDEVKDCWVEI